MNSQMETERPLAVIKVKRRVEHKAFWLQIAAMLCAAFAAAGIAHGMHEANPDGGWAIPIAGGVVAAIGFASIWHVLIGSIIGMVRLTMIIATFAGAILLTVVTLGGSAQAIATAIAGRAALAAELSSNIEGYSKALAKAHAEATEWGSLSGTANAKASGYEVQAESEAGGGNGTGKGCGPRCTSLRDMAGNFRASQHAMDDLLARAADERKRGEIAMQSMRDAASRGNQDGFMAAAGEVTAVVADLNAIDPRPIIEHTGAVTASEKGIDLTQETEEFHAEAAKLTANREVVETPVFLPMTLGDATRAQAFGAAMHGWILAGAIDVLPLLFLFFAFVISREVWLQEDVHTTVETVEGRKKRDRDDLAALQGRNVVKMKAAE